MSLPNAPDKYDRNEQTKVRAQIDRMDYLNRKKGQDLEVAGTERLIKASPDGARWEIVVDNAGVLSAVAL